MSKNNTIGQLLKEAYESLKEVGVDTYMLDAQLLMGKALGESKLYVLTNRDKKVDEEVVEKFNEFIKLRRDKMPVKYILKECEFMGMELFVKEGVLIPRPDTEILVEEVISEISNRGHKYICDVCSGSGAIGLAVAKHIETVAVECYDISEYADEVSNENIRRLSLEERVKFFYSDLLEEAIKENKIFDLIVSNPPYIRDEVIPTLMEDVKNYEPYIALSGGADGLEFYRRITEQSVSCLKSQGMLAFEIGYDQRVEVMEILSYKGFVDVKCIKDLGGNDRVVTGIKI